MKYYSTFITTLMLLCVPKLGLAQNTNSTLDAEIAGFASYLARSPLWQVNPDTLFRNVKSPELVGMAKFFRAGLEGRSIIAEEYLMLPTHQTLCYMKAIDAVHQAKADYDLDRGSNIVHTTLNTEFPNELLVQNYYRILFTLAIKPQRPFDFTNVNIDPERYTSNDSVYSSILYLELMKSCYKHIWGYLNVPKPPKYEEAMKYITKFPKVKGRNYYSYKMKDFPDFSGAFVAHNEKYKKTAITELYDLLVGHIVCAHKMFLPSDVIQAISRESIINDSVYYKYYDRVDILKKLSAEDQ